MICASSKVTDCLSATDPATLTASPQRVFKSRCYFCSSTNGCADHLPTAVSTTDQTLNIAQTADSKPPIIALTKPSRISSPIQVRSATVQHRRHGGVNGGGKGRGQGL